MCFCISFSVFSQRQKTLFQKSIDSLNLFRESAYRAINSYDTFVSDIAKKGFTLPYVIQKVSQTKDEELITWLDSLPKIQKQYYQDSAVYFKYKVDIEKKVSRYTGYLAAMTLRYVKNVSYKNFFLNTVREGIKKDKIYFNEYYIQNMLSKKAYEGTFQKIAIVIDSLELITTPIKKKG